jgi:hypothetical protein
MHHRADHVYVACMISLAVLSQDLRQVYLGHHPDNCVKMSRKQTSKDVGPIPSVHSIEPNGKMQPNGLSVIVEKACFRPSVTQGPPANTISL